MSLFLFVRRIESYDSHKLCCTGALSSPDSICYSSRSIVDNDTNVMYFACIVFSCPTFTHRSEGFTCLHDPSFQMRGVRAAFQNSFPQLCENHDLPKACIVNCDHRIYIVSSDLRSCIPGVLTAMSVYPYMVMIEFKLGSDVIPASLVRLKLRYADKNKNW